MSRPASIEAWLRVPENRRSLLLWAVVGAGIALAGLVGLRALPHFGPVAVDGYLYAAGFGALVAALFKLRLSLSPLQNWDEMERGWQQLQDELDRLKARAASDPTAAAEYRTRLRALITDIRAARPGRLGDAVIGDIEAELRRVSAKGAA